MKKAQWITVGISLLLVAGIYIYGRTIPGKKNSAAETSGPNSATDSKKETEQPTTTTDTILALAKKQLSEEQVIRLNTLEHSISRGDVKDQQLHVFHQLARFWSDS